MTDLHSHILWQVDDGSLSLEMSHEMLKTAATTGTKSIFATPHAIADYNMDSWFDAMVRVRTLQEFSRAERLELDIYSGAEVFMNWDLLPLLGKDGFCCMADSHYILVELPMHEIPVYADDFWFELRLKGLRPILAHPERYRRLCSNWDTVLKWREEGLLLQCNTGSFTGYFGREIASNAHRFLKEGLVDFIGSDAHRDHGRSTDMSEAAMVIKELVGEGIWKLISEENPKMVIADKPITISKPVKSKKRGVFRRLFG